MAALTTTLTAFRDAASEAKTQDRRHRHLEPRALATELPQAIEPLTALANLPNPAAELGNNPELDQAAAQAPQCQQVDSRHRLTRTRPIGEPTGGSSPLVIERVFYRSRLVPQLSLFSAEARPPRCRRPGRAAVRAGPDRPVRGR